MTLIIRVVSTHTHGVGRSLQRIARMVHDRPEIAKSHGFDYEVGERGGALKVISLRAMSDIEYAAYVAYFIPDYAEEIAKNYELSFEDAEDQAKLEIQNALPEGLTTEGQVLLSVVLIRSGGEKVVGSFWYKPDFVAKSAFVYDFYMLPPWRGKGMGREALAVLEDRLAAEGLKQFKLRVAADNVRAKHVYDYTGFRVTGINMMKKIGDGQ